MEQLGTQIARPIYVHQPLPGRAMAKKRDLPWQNPSFHQQQQPQWYQHNGNGNGNWDPKLWEWDSVRFVGKATEAETPLSMAPAVPMVETGQRRKGEKETKQMVVEKPLEEDPESLTLKLGGSSYSGEEPATRPNKRVRSGSPGNASYPMCQVDDCKADLTNAKDYHRRHKVCQIHSKTTKALVGKQMQRFCQQCSRFHPLSEFDEGKRSCRRRLAGHNRRRRKTQPEDVSSRPPQNMENNTNGNLDIMNLLTVLARLQGNNAGKITNGAPGPIPDRDRLIQILNKLNPSAGATNPSIFPVSRGFDLNVSQQIPSEHLSKINGNTTAPSTMDLLTVLSAAVGASSPDNLANLSRSSHSSNDDKTKTNGSDQPAGCKFQNTPLSGYQPVGMERSCTTFHSPVEVSDGQAHEAHPSLPLQLFTSSLEDECPSKMDSARKYLSSDSSNPMEERSPSSSPPVEHKLFPLRNASENMKHESLSTSGEDNATAEVSTTRGWNPPMEFFKDSNSRARNSVVQNISYQVGYASSSGSDHSPSSSKCDSQDRTGRILFKLFDKDPSSFPATFRTQILNWLAQSPSEIESYIRPGCVVLSIYISMSSTAWKLFQDDLFQRVHSLVQDSEFWRSGRFLVHTEKQLASHKDGKIHLCKSWRTWSSPELISVVPLAIVAGQKTSLALRGRNLTVPGTKIHCTYMGGYLSKEVEGSAGTVYDDASSETFSFPGGAPSTLGRCFIEVENGIKGNSFPVIIADSLICQELRLLESEFEEEARVSDANTDDMMQDSTLPRSREDVMYFLNELGWLFQRKNSFSFSDLPDFSLNRFKFLFTFSVERDWCALVKKLLDILAERNSSKDGLSKDSLDMLSEVHLLNRAVKRKCRGMVRVLVNYSIASDSTKKYIFPPNHAGPGGITPLHLAASTEDSEAVVDALTNDPQQIALTCWNSLPDASGQSPCDYAMARRNYSYNRLVERKIVDRKHGQVSIRVGNEISDQSWAIERVVKQLSQSWHGKQQSCTRCATTMTKHYSRGPVSQGVLHRPYMRSMLAIAAVCVCVSLFLRGSPDIGSVAPFKWENLGYGTI